MAYLRCTQCGAKALSVASQCPRCAHPFDVHDARGMRVKLAFCRGCRFMHRSDTACPTCGERPTRAPWASVSIRQLAAAAGMIAVVGLGWQMRGTLVNARAQGFSTGAMAPLPPMATKAAASSIGASRDSTLSAPLGVATSEATTIAPAAMAVIDSLRAMRWVPAVARTWVNVRSNASREGEVVGVIKPSSRAMLGEDRGGWRLVKSPEFSGWVDPRLFDADSVSSRGQ